MNDIKQLASRITVAASVAILVGTSAFADSRHSQETRSHESRRFERSDRGEQRQQSRQNDQERRQSAETFRNRDRNNDRQTFRDNEQNFRNNNGSRDNRSYRNNSNHRDNNSYRESNRNRDNRNYRDNNRYRNDSRSGNRSPYFAHGRVSRYERFGGGYRVWLGGVPYPFFIPEARFRLFPRFYVGLDLRLGGYYNSGGYYDYYDDASYDGGYAYDGGVLRGVVESVDLRRGTIFVREDRTGSFVRVVMRNYDRLADDIRIGDVIDLSGDWSRGGTFEAYRIENLNPRGSFYR